METHTGCWGQAGARGCWCSLCQEAFACGHLLPGRSAQPCLHGCVTTTVHVGPALGRICSCSANKETRSVQLLDGSGQGGLPCSSPVPRHH